MTGIATQPTVQAALCALQSVPHALQSTLPAHAALRAPHALQTTPARWTFRGTCLVPGAVTATSIGTVPACTHHNIQGGRSLRRRQPHINGRVHGGNAFCARIAGPRGLARPPKKQPLRARLPSEGRTACIRLLQHRLQRARGQTQPPAYSRTWALHTGSGLPDRGKQSLC